MVVDYGSSNAGSGDKIELYLEGSPDKLIGSDISGGGSSSTISDDGNILLSESGGLKYFYARVIDVAGNIGPDSTTPLELTLDRDAPSATITGNGFFGYGTYATVDLGSSSSDSDISKYEWSVTNADAGTSGATYSPSDYDTDLSSFALTSCSIDGDYTASLDVYDIAGNKSTAPDTFDFIWDGTQFTQTVTGFPATAYAGSQLSLLTTPDGAECLIGSYLWEVTSAAGAYTLGSATSAATTFDAEENDGDYTLRLTTTDNLGRQRIYSDTFTWETTPPTFSNTISDKNFINSGFDETAVGYDTGSLIDASTYQWTIDDDDSAAQWTPSAGATLHVNDGDVNEVSLTDGNYTATCTVSDNAENECLPGDRLTFSFSWDESNPVIDNISFDERTSGKLFVTDGDIIDLEFDVSDAAGVSGTPSVTIFSDPVDSGDISESSGTYSTSYTVPSKTASAGGTEFGYLISSTDVIGNGPATSGVPDALTYYSAYNNSLSSYFYSAMSTVSDNQNGATYWAKNGDRVTVTFTGVRDLLSDPVVTIGGRTATIVDYDTGTLECEAFLIINGTETDGVDPLDENDPIPVTISVTDKAGNPGAYTFNSSVVYDITPPAKPGTPTYPAQTNSGFINSANISSGSITFNVTGLEAGTTTLYVHYNSTDTALETTTGTGTQNITVNESSASALKTALGGDGSKEFYAITVDAAGNTGDASDNFSVVLDTVIDSIDAGSSFYDSDAKTSGWSPGCLGFRQCRSAYISLDIQPCKRVCNRQ